MITWSDFVMLVNIKITESKVNGKEPEIKYISISQLDDVEDINVVINKDNQLEIT